MTSGRRNQGPVPSVYFHSQYQLWHSRVYYEKRHIHVGRYPDRDTALDKAEERIAEILNPPVEPPEKSWVELAAESRQRIASAA